MIFRNGITFHYFYTGLPPWHIPTCEFHQINCIEWENLTRLEILVIRFGLTLFRFAIQSIRYANESLPTVSRPHTQNKKKINFFDYDTRTHSCKCLWRSMAFGSNNESWHHTHKSDSNSTIIRMKIRICMWTYLCVDRQSRAASSIDVYSWEYFQIVTRSVGRFERVSAQNAVTPNRCNMFCTGLGGAQFVLLSRHLF